MTGPPRRGETLTRVAPCLHLVTDCPLCSSSDDSNRSARDAATTGAALGARLGSRAGPVSTGVGAGFGAAAGYLVGSAVDETVGGLVPDGGRDRARAPRGVDVAVREADD